MNAPPPADKAPPADAVSKGYEEKAAKARGSKKVNDKLEAVGRIGEAISAEVQKVIIGKSHVIDNVLVILGLMALRRKLVPLVLAVPIF